MAFWIVDNYGGRAMGDTRPDSLDRHQSRRDLPSGSRQPTGHVASTPTGMLWIVDSAATSYGRCRTRLTPGTFVPTTAPCHALLQHRQGLSFDAAGTLWIVDNTGDEAWEIPDPTSVPGTAPITAPMPSGPHGSHRAYRFDTDGHAVDRRQQRRRSMGVYLIRLTPGTGTNHGDLPGHAHGTPA